MTILDSCTRGKSGDGLVRNIRSVIPGDELYQDLFTVIDGDVGLSRSVVDIDYLQAVITGTPAGTPVYLTTAAITQLTKKYTENCDTDALARLASIVANASSPTGMVAITAEELKASQTEVQANLNSVAIRTYAVEHFPVLVGTDNADLFRSARTVLRGYGDGKLLQQAGIMLNIAVASHRKQSAWMYWRLGPMLDLEKFFQEIINWIEAAAKAIQGVIDTILEYINYIQARIREIQALIRKINAIIQSIFLFEIPAGYVSFYYSDGTDGLLMDFMSAENKPTDAPTAWGACALAVLPLIPYTEFWIDLFFPGLSEDDTGETTGGEAAI